MVTADGLPLPRLAERKEVLAAGMLAAGVKSTAAHAQAPTDTNRQVLRTLGRTKSNEFSPPNGGQKGDDLEKTNDSRMPILCSHAFACCGGSKPDLRC